MTTRIYLLAASIALARLSMNSVRLRTPALEWFCRVRQFVRNLTRSTAGRSPRVRATNLNANLIALEASIRSRLPGAINCRFSLVPGLWFAQVDTGILVTMIPDLVVEAASDMLGGGDIIVGTRLFTISNGTAAEFPGTTPGDYMRVTVKDAGKGLSPERLERIFYPESARPAAAAAWQLMDRVGGFAAVESAESIGTAVHLYFRRTVIQRQSARPDVMDKVQALAAE